MENNTPRISPDTYARAVREKLITDPYDPTYHNGARNPYTKAIITCEADYIEYVNEFIYDWLTAKQNLTDQGFSQVDSSQRSTHYYVETPDGMVVRVPADKLDSWAAADHNAPLTPAEEQLKRKILDDLYGKDSSAPIEVEKPIGYIPNSSYVPVPWWRNTKIMARLALGLIAAAVVCAVIFAIFPGLDPTTASPVNATPFPSATITRPPAASADPTPMPSESLSLREQIDRSRQAGAQSTLPAPLSKPYSGKIFFENTYSVGERIAPLTIDASAYPLSSGFYVYLRQPETKVPVLTFYVRGNTKPEVQVPIGTFELLYASGTEWYGRSLLFGPDTKYYRADELFEFYEEDGYVNGWTITLDKRYNGNLDIDEIDASEFG